MLYRFQIADRVDGVVNVNHLVALERANNVENAVNSLDV